MSELIRICRMTRPVPEPMGTLMFTLEMTVGLLRRRIGPCLYNDVAVGGISGIIRNISFPATGRIR